MRPTLPQGNQMLNLILQKRSLTSERLQNLYTTGIISNLFDVDLDEKSATEIKEIIFRVRVSNWPRFNINILDPDTPLNDLISLCNLTCVDRDITDNDPTKKSFHGMGTKTVFLASFGIDISHAGIMNQLSKIKMRPATSLEFITLLYQWPSILDYGEMVALADYWLLEWDTNKNKRVLTASSNGSGGKFLKLVARGGDWTERYLFPVASVSNPL